MAFKLEICTPNQASVDAAVTAKVDRIELCAALEIGGITPSPAAIEYSIQQIETHVLIRPRTGHFSYSRKEYQAILNDILFCKKACAAGVVIGILDEQNMPKIEGLKVLREAASGMECTFHRAFDFCANPVEALEILIDLGFSRVLTSGKANSALEGVDVLKKLQEQAVGRITIMPGGGISANNIQEIQQITGCIEFHASAKKRITNRNITVGELDNSYWASDSDIIFDMKKKIALIK